MSRWLLLLVAAAVGCGTLSFAERKDLYGVVSRDHGCNRSEIEMVSEETDRIGGTGEYMLEACGKRRKYRMDEEGFYDATARAKEGVRRENSKRKLDAAEETPITDDGAPPEEED